MPEGMTVEFRLLGDIEARIDGRFEVLYSYLSRLR
jgi:hypothetical protein